MKIYNVTAIKDGDNVTVSYRVSIGINKYATKSFEITMDEFLLIGNSQEAMVKYIWDNKTILGDD